MMSDMYLLSILKNLPGFKETFDIQGHSSPGNENSMASTMGNLSVSVGLLRMVLFPTFRLNVIMGGPSGLSRLLL